MSFSASFIHAGRELNGPNPIDPLVKETMGTYSSSEKYASDAKSLEALKMLPSPTYLRLILWNCLYVVQIISQMMKL